MAKTKTIHICSNCGASSVRWEGKCPSCGEWNTFVEETVEAKKVPNSTPGSRVVIPDSTPLLLRDITAPNTNRIDITHDTELARVLGGGIVPGSIVLIGGQPGIGKSTLMLQLACLSRAKVLYVSGEESPYQIKMRADRIGPSNQDCLILAETNLQKVLSIARKVRPDIIMIDSIQTIHSQDIDSTAGSVSQIKECTSELQQYAKQTNIPVFIIGHITKEGAIAGPKILEHIVDVVLQFEGDRNYVYRILRTIKNRFGSTDEIGIYEMEKSGLRPVTNPSELLLSQSNEKLSGSSIACTIEGVRPLLIETQALVSSAIFGTPQRSSTGFDIRRLSMLLAVLEKKCGLYFSQNDVFLNIAGGIRVTDPAIDMSIVAALISSLQDIPIDPKICLAGEIGLSGEVRAVNRIEQRVQEAARLGFSQIFISKYHKKGAIKNVKNIEVKTIGKVEELVMALFT